MGRMALFERPPRPDRAQLAELHDQTGDTERPLAFGTGDGTAVFITRNRFAVRGTNGRWLVLGWEEILSGGWVNDARMLRWTTMTGAPGEITLDDPGLVPELFRDRVNASFVAEERVTVPGGEVLITGRRNPGSPGSEVFWHALPMRGADLDDPQTRQLVIDVTEQLRANYDVGG